MATNRIEDTVETQGAKPSPLSTIRTELIWEGKYDDNGLRREVDVSDDVLPLQKIETIDEPRSKAEVEGDEIALFNLSKQAEKLGDFRNFLIWGDNKLVAASLLQKFRGSVNLIYIDPPFDVGADFTLEVPVGTDEVVDKGQSILEMVAYRDMWGRGTDSYLHMMYERLVLMRELLSATGSIFVHCDWRMKYVGSGQHPEAARPAQSALRQITTRFSSTQKAQHILSIRSTPNTQRLK